MNTIDFTREPNEPELLPCPFCGEEASLYVEKFHDAVAYCPYCNITTEGINGIYKRRRAIETWNRRVPAAGQWTTEPPKESGIYIAKRIRVVEQDEHRIFDYSNHTDKEVAEICQNLSEFYPDALWLKLDVPPLPEGKESKQ